MNYKLFEIQGVIRDDSIKIWLIHTDDSCDWFSLNQSNESSVWISHKLIDVVLLNESVEVRELGIYPMQAHNSSKTKKSEKLLDFKDF